MEPARRGRADTDRGNPWIPRADPRRRRRHEDGNWRMRGGPGVDRGLRIGGRWRNGRSSALARWDRLPRLGDQRPGADRRGVEPRGRRRRPRGALGQGRRDRPGRLGRAGRSVTRRGDQQPRADRRVLRAALGRARVHPVGARSVDAQPRAGDGLDRLVDPLGHQREWRGLRAGAPVARLCQGLHLGRRQRRADLRDRRRVHGRCGTAG